METYFSLYDEGRIKLFKLQGGEEDARQLLLYALDIDMNELLLHYTDSSVDEEKAARYRALIEKRAAGVPLQYLTHVQNFCGLDMYVDENVLIPRYDTEILVETVLENEKHLSATADGSACKLRVLDMCTGSGCIAIALAKLGGYEVYGADISRRALEIADRNAAANGVDITFYESCMFDQLGELRDLDVIVSNPPYIKRAVIDSLMTEVRDHEPRTALDGGVDGLDFYRIIARDAHEHLKAGGRLYLEIGYDQAEEVSALLTQERFSNIHVVKDLSGLDRVVYASI